MDIILKSSPAGARKLQAIIAQGPRPTEVKFHKSEPTPQELLSLPQESSKGSEYHGFFKLSLVADEDGATRVKIYNGVVDFVANESPLSYARVNAGLFSVAPFVSESTFTPSTTDNKVLAYFYLVYDKKENSMEIKQRTSDGADASVSILLGKICSVNGTLRVIQDSYGTPFLPIFFSCDWSV